MTQNEIRRLRKLCLEATCGPWDRAAHGPENLMLDPAGLVVIGTCATIADCTESPTPRRRANAAFIAAAREALPAALDEIERLRKQLDLLKNCDDESILFQVKEMQKETK